MFRANLDTKYFNRELKESIMVRKSMKQSLIQTGVIKNWDEALPLGNGTLGCLIYGENELRFAVDRIDLWDKRQCETSKGKDFNYKTLVECLNGGEKGWQNKEEIFEFNDKYPYPTKLSAGRIELTLGKKIESFHSILNLAEAKANVKANVKANEVSVEAFVSATKKVGVIKIVGDYTLHLHIPNYFSGDKNGKCVTSSGLISNEGVVQVIDNGCLEYPRAEVITDGEFIYYVQNTLTDYSFAVIVLIKKKAGYSEVYYTITTTDDGQDYFHYGKKLLLESAKLGYEALFTAHKKWWRSYWRKSAICIPDKTLMEAYYTSWYLFASTSRKGGYPIPLQGVWTADSDAIPPWNGDYHYDTNVQMSYWAYGRANRLEEGKVLVDYLWKNRKVFHKFAKSFYGVEGYMLPACATIDGKPMGGWTQYALSPSMTVWTAKAFDDYYQATGDIAFLKNKAFPFMEEVARAIEGLLTEKSDKYYLPASTSPEIYEGDSKTSTIGNTNFDQSLLLYLFKTLKEYCDILNVSSEKYVHILSKLDDLYVIDGKLALSEKCVMPYSHRHHSHLMGIYPLRLLNADNEKERKIMEKSILELEQLGTGWWVGFSFPWAANLYNTLGNGNAAYEKLRIFVKGFLSPNGFHLNGDYKNQGFSQWHYRPFTLEALYSYCDAVQSMLLEDYKGHIELFPSLPDEWRDKKIAFKRLLSGGCEISATFDKGKITHFSVSSKLSRTVKIKNVFGGEQFSFSNGQNVYCPFGEIFELKVDKNGCTLL